MKYSPDQRVITLIQLQVATVHTIAPQLQYLLSVPHISPSSNSVLQVLSLQGEIFINQIIGDIYTYDFTNRLLISSNEIDHNTAVDLQNF